VLPLKELGERTVGERVTGWDGKLLKGLEGLPGGRVPQMRPGCPANPTGMRRTQRKRTLRAGAQKSYPTKQTYYSILVQLVKYYFKWCVCWEIVWGRTRAPA